MAKIINIYTQLSRSAHWKAGFVLSRWSYLWLAILFGLINLMPATAHAQELAVNPLAVSTKATGSWWPEHASLTGAPHLQFGMASLSRFDPFNSESSNSPRAEPPIRYVEDPIDNSMRFEADDAARARGLSYFAESEPPSPLNALSLIEARYVTWESYLSDTRTLTYANGVFVYPLLQLSYAQSNLPVTLYISPLRGEATPGDE